MPSPHLKPLFLAVTTTLSLLLAGLPTAVAQKTGTWMPAPTCKDLVWSAQLVKGDPDIQEFCQGVYVKGDTLYAKLRIELTRIRGNRLSFRAIHPNGRQGQQRSITVKTGWRIKLDGEELRATDLQPGQQLSVYIPEDRFALTLDDGSLDGNEEMISIDNPDVQEPQ